MIRETLKTAIHDALTSLGLDAPAKGIDLERPANLEHGDWSTNVALASAKAAGKNPRELATEIQAAVEGAAVAHLEAVEIAGPGFINFRLADTWLFEILDDVLASGEDNFGRVNIGNGQKVLVEFISANPTGPLHAGHARGAVYGDALAEVMSRCGYDIGREYLFNDRGLQMQHYADSLAAAAAGEPTPEDGYSGEYIKEWAAQMPADADPLEWGYEVCRNFIAETVRRLGINFDSWFSEREQVGTGAIDAALAKLREQQTAYDKDDAVWLESTKFGDDKDRVLVRSGGEPTYLLPDIAYHINKFERGWEHLINVWGADHHGYVTRLKAGVQACGYPADSLELLITQIVRLERDGEEVRIGKRSGEYIALRDIIDEVGKDATRFSFLLQSIDSQQTVDLASIATKDMDNPVFYVQMAHARACSIKDKAAEAGFAVQPTGEVDLSPLGHDRELEVLRALSELPELMVVACRDRAPHKIATWVRKLAGAFHGFYHDCYVVGDGISPELSQARLQLVEAARIGVATGLSVLGVSSPKEMR